MSHWTPILAALKITDEHDSRDIARARKDLVRQTVIPRAEFFYGAEQILPTRDGDQLPAGQVEMARMRTVQLVHNKLTKDGYVSNEAVIAGNMREEADKMFGHVRLRWTYPRPHPDTGDPARIAGGPDHGERLEVPARWDSIILPVYIGTRPSTEYTLYGFDTATGEWVYVPTNGRA